MTSMVWLSKFVDKFGEKLPTNNKIHLPSCLTRGNVYWIMKEEVEEQGGSVCSQQYFFRKWRHEMSHVTIPKVNRFSKWDICTKLKPCLEKTTGREERQTLLQERESHLFQQK
ncbi:uncharacterized protein LOC135156392 [Lytechinus pictus]|uniref:uncharacterized protein LOC135156392 n=1 Tax=Lytechinus pictus TaxID=7653 RepID=UPI0030BA125F